MNPTLTLVLYCLLVMAASVFGGVLPARMRWSHRTTNLVMAFVAGIILGIGLFHLLPHSVASSGSLDRSLWWMMIGLLAMFLITRTLNGHHHAPDPEPGHGVVDTGHKHHHHPERQHHNWIGLAFGMSIHSLFDGIALAASVTDEHAVAQGGWLLGLGTFAAVVLHKPLDAMSITSLMARANGSEKLTRMVNFGFALIVPVGAALFAFGVHQFSHRADVILGGTLAFSAGVFVCIALGDLLPELHFHPRDRIRLSAALVLGVTAAHAMGSLEPDHLHHPHAETHQATSQSADSHDSHVGHNH